MYKYILSFTIIIGLSTFICAQEVIIDEGDNSICQELMDLFGSNNDLNAVACLIKINQDIGPFLYTVTLDGNDGCNLLSLVGNQELRIPSKTEIKLLNGFQIKLSDNAKITGDQFSTSKIVIASDGADNTAPTDLTAIDMTDCSGCVVSTLTIESEKRSDNTDANTRTGLEIGGGENNEVNEVKFKDIDTGLVVNGGGHNTFNDLQFLFVGIPPESEKDCDATNNTTSAVQLVGSSNNNFTNMTHNQSPGAITVHLKGLCNYNTILNISVEQEGTHCTTSAFNDNDPALYIDNSSVVGNIITCNFNHAKATGPDNGDICTNNIVSAPIVDNLNSCERAQITMGCGSN